MGCKRAELNLFHASFALIKRIGRCCGTRYETFSPKLPADKKNGWQSLYSRRY